jgi:predicted DNA-binding transcriptional regulator YafY
MPIASSPSTSRRLLALLSLLQSRRDWSAAVLADRLEVSERTVRRDIDRLRELDYAIHATRGPDGGYRLGTGAQLPPLMFDDEQVVALILALRTAGTLGAGVEEAAERALGTVTRLLPDRLSHRVASLAGATSANPGDAAATVDPAVLLRIGEAVRAQEELRFDYASPDPEAPVPPVRSVQPHHLLLHDGRWYLLGYSDSRGEWRIYRADRITPRTHNGAPFTARPVPGGDPARFLAARFKGSTEADAWPCQGSATLDAPLAEIAPYIRDGTIEAVGPDRSRVHLGAWSWESLAAEFCRFGAAMTDARPAPLRTAFAAVAARASAAAAE